VAKILLGITGGIAAYKACDIINMLKRSHEVRVVMTENATKFITPLTIEALSTNPVMTTMWVENSKINHIDESQLWADIFLVAPATTNIIAKFANGIADDLMSTMFMSTTARVIIAPAMNTHMYKHPINKKNMTRLVDRVGVTFVDPVTKMLACGVEGEGALASPSDIVKKVEELLNDMAVSHRT